MRTTRELRQQNHLPVPSNPDSEYKPIIREEKAPAPIRIRHKLQKDLPFKLQQKTSAMVSKRKKKQPIRPDDVPEKLVVDHEERKK